MFGQSTIVVDGHHRFRDLDKPMLEQGYDFHAVRIEDDATVTTKCTIIADLGHARVRRRELGGDAADPAVHRRGRRARAADRLLRARRARSRRSWLGVPGRRERLGQRLPRSESVRARPDARRPSTGSPPRHDRASRAPRAPARAGCAAAAAKQLVEVRLEVRVACARTARSATAMRATRRRPEVEVHRVQVLADGGAVVEQPEAVVAHPAARGRGPRSRTGSRPRRSRRRARAAPRLTDTLAV